MAVVADQNPELAEGVIDLDFNAFCASVAEGVNQRLPADSVYIVTQKRTQRPGLPLHNDAKFDSLIRFPIWDKLILYPGKGVFEIKG